METEIINSSASSNKTRSHSPLQERSLKPTDSWENLVRSIPNRSAINIKYACCIPAKGKENLVGSTPSMVAYKKLLAETSNRTRTWIMSLNKPKASEKTLADDYCLNLLDWGRSNILSMALGNTVYLWDASEKGSTSVLVTVDQEKGPVTSVKFAPDGRHIAVGLNNSEVQLWDSTANRLLRTLRGGHISRVGAMDWSNHILTTGGMDGQIFNNDVRVRSHIVDAYRGHRQEVCGLKWSASGQQLASGGNDNLLHIWDGRCTASSSNYPTRWLHRLEDHTSAVKALAWGPQRTNLLASGGGDRCIKFWNSDTGCCLNSVDTGSPVCALLWNKNNLLSSHGFTQNHQLTLWKYPSMMKATFDTPRVLYMAQSPDGCTVASASGDETLRFWNVFVMPEVAQPVRKKTDAEPFAEFNRIR